MKAKALMGTPKAMDTLGKCAVQLSVKKIFVALSYVLSKQQMVELGEKLIEEGSKA
jgi:hypothetical protein